MLLSAPLGTVESGRPHVTYWQTQDSSVSLRVQSVNWMFVIDAVCGCCIKHTSSGGMLGWEAAAICSGGQRRRSPTPGLYTELYMVLLQKKSPSLQAW